MAPAVTSLTAVWLDQLPLPSRLGKTRVGDVDLNNERMRRALSDVLALAPSPTGFTTAHFRAKVQAMTGLPSGDYTHRQAAYDLKKLRAKDLIARVRRSRRYQPSPPSMRASTALLVLRDHGVSGRRESHPPALSELSVSLSTHSAPIVQPSGRTSRQ